MITSISRKRTKKIGLVLGPALFLAILSLPIEEHSNRDYINSSTNSEEMVNITFSSKIVLASTFWMAIWWITETIPIYVTSLLPLVLFPSLNVTDLGQTASNYADRIIFLFLGGFILAKAVEKSQLHKRFALNILKIFGTTPKYIVAAFMFVTGLLSAWMSNTATTVLMLPIAAAVISQIGREGMAEQKGDKSKKNEQLNFFADKNNNKDSEIEKSKVENEQRSRFGLCLMLSIAYSASIGGLATLIGTPPNAIFASISRSMLNIDISFGQWLLIGIPISGISLLVAWIYLVHVGVKITDIKKLGGKNNIVQIMTKEIGKITKDEKIVAVVFVATATAWVTRGLLWGHLVPMVDDSTIAIAAAFSLFLIPSSRSSLAKEKQYRNSFSNGNKDDNSSRHTDKNDNNDKKNYVNHPENNIQIIPETKNDTARILDWKTAVTIPWGVLILIGGGLALSDAYTETGLDKWISNKILIVENMNYFMLILVIVTITIFFGEIASNTAGAALLIPIAVSLASSISIEPLLIMVPIAIATSYGFIMPVGTPPNAIVFENKYVTAPKMARAGLPLDIIAIVMVTGLTTVLVPQIFGG